MTKPTGVPVDKNRAHLFAFSLGFLFQRHLRKVLQAHGWSIRFGLPLGREAAVAVWGRTPVASRGQTVARLLNRPVVTFEDAFLRSVLTGRQNAPAMGVVADRTGIYFDTTQPSDLDDFLKASADLPKAEIKQAADELAYLLRLGLSKYNDFTSRTPDLPDDFVLVVDQTLNDAAIRKGGANARSFADMLDCAKSENPTKKILIKTHPETIAGKRVGYFSQTDCDEQTTLISAQIAPAAFFEKAAKVYCVTSQMGMEAIFAGHRPVVFGRPFYAGLGLSDDRGPGSGKGLNLSAAQLFWATHLQYSKWYDPYFDCAADFGMAATILHAQARQNRDNHLQAVCLGMRLWKRGFLKTYLSGSSGVPRFLNNEQDAAKMAHQEDGQVLVWAGKETDTLASACDQANVPLIRVEDGFLRSVGLGAKLVTPLSLVFDDTGIYYDPTRPSGLERIINASDGLTDYELARARAVQERIVALKMTKYNLSAAPVTLSVKKGQQIILVPGQVEDDASIKKGAGRLKTNLDLLRAVRRDFPDAYIVYKPHPDVEAGLRTGAIETGDLADHVARTSNMDDLLTLSDRVATLTSLAGFEALLRDKPVTCYGQPFYSGWGLTDDKAGKIPRRRARPALLALIHACLIEYPRYWDTVTRTPCPVETVLERFERGQMQVKSGAFRRILAKLQGIFASYAHLWR
jgi:capsular polysaccharide export protein